MRPVWHPPHERAGWRSLLALALPFAQPPLRTFLMRGILFVRAVSRGNGRGRGRSSSGAPPAAFHTRGFSPACQGWSYGFIPESPWTFRGSHTVSSRSLPSYRLCLRRVFSPVFQRVANPIGQVVERRPGPVILVSSGQAVSLRAALWGAAA